MVRNLLLLESFEPIALEYLSANSHATVKSMQSVPNIASICSPIFFAFLNGTIFRIYGKFTLSGRYPINGPQIVIILQPFFNPESLGIILSLIFSSENQKS